ncbi:MAG: histidine kinase N-terminal 7TM domain-containing protein [Halapricum sp.]
MGWQYTAYVYPTVFAAFVAAGLAVYTARHLYEHGADPVRSIFLAIAVTMSLWAGFSALKLLQTDPGLKLQFYRLLYLGIAPTGVLSVLFALAYTDRTDWLRPSVVLGLSVAPAAYLLILFTDPGGLAIQSTQYIEVGDLVVLRTETGPAHLLVMQLYTPLLGLTAVGIVGYESLRLGRAYLPQAALLTVAVLIAIVFSALTALEVPPFDRSNVNLVPTSAAISAVAFGIATFRYRWFDLPPVAYTTVLKDAPYGVFVVDQNERIVHANTCGETLLDSLDTAVGDRVDTVFPTVNPWTDDRAIVDVDTEVERTLEVRIERIERYGSLVGVVLVTHDITDQRQRRCELREQKQRLDEFASVVSHDLRSPLAVASGRLEMLRGECDDETLDQIEQAHSRMERLIDDLLSLAREGAVVQEPDEVSLRELVEECWAMTPAREATLYVEVEPECTIRADESRLRQLFGNLFRNAIDHAGEDITITVGTHDDGFYVADDGPGIPADQRESVLKSGYSVNEDGMGLGLTIVRQIASAHSWTLQVTASEADGAQFEVEGVEFASS